MSIAWVGLTPLPHPLNMVWPLEITRIFCEPFSLACGLACLAALRQTTVVLPIGVAMIRDEEDGAVPAVPFSNSFHDPLPPGHAFGNQLVTHEENEEKSGRRR